MVTILKVAENTDGWLYFAFIVVFYAPFRIVTDITLSILWECPGWLVKTIPIVLFICLFGAAYYLD